MKKFCSFLMVLLLFPIPALAACSVEGATVVFVNGIFNDQKKAEESTRDLRKEIEQRNPEVSVINGYNPSHLGGAGDLVQSIFQAFGNPISKYDLDTILMQIHPE